MPRKHLVLVPGFVGFDVLGQVGYYAGVTSLFRSWRSRCDRPEATLHYFDNFPTASVSMRAERLRVFLGKRIARGEIAPHDEVTLLGHSTGGLDIRRLLLDLLQAHETTVVDDRLVLAHDELLAPIRRAVFISVPHYGSNLADFFYDYRPTVQSLVHDAAIGLQYNRGFIGDARRWLASMWPDTRSDLLLALHDSLNESDVHPGASARQRAKEREALAQLTLWLDHMAADFGALTDLTTAARTEQSDSPAHASQADRREELRLWRGHHAALGGIRTQSYATRVPSEDVTLPWVVTAGLQVARGMMLPMRALYEALRITDSIPYAANKVRDVAARTRVGIDSLALPPALLALHARPALLFEFAQGACAVGAFEKPSTRDLCTVPELLAKSTTRRMDPRSITAADNDGIVNTLSMLWPHDAQHQAEHPAEPEAHEAFFVRSDHADVIGHYRRRPEHPEPGKAAGSDRLYDAYDIFDSGSGFDDARFEQVWQSIFDFAFPT